MRSRLFVLWACVLVVAGCDPQPPLAPLDAGRPDGAEVDAAPTFDAEPRPDAFVATLRFEQVELGTLGGAESRVYDIDDAGRVVGAATTATGEQHAFLWEGGQMIDLLPAGPATSQAVAINKRGEVVIQASGASGKSEVWLWDKGTARYLGYGRADALGDGGVVAMGRIVGNGLKALIVWVDGEEIVVAESTGLEALGVSESGNVLYQTWQFGDVGVRTFVYSTAQRTQMEVRSPAGLPPTMYGVVMNQQGDVVGVSPEEPPFAWQAGVSVPIAGAENAPLGAEPHRINTAGDFLLYHGEVDRQNPFYLFSGGVLYPVEERPDYVTGVWSLGEAGRLVGGICKYCAVPDRAVVWELGRIAWVHPGNSWAVAANARGEVAGNLLKVNDFRAVLWRPLCGSEPCP